ncbi:MAG: protease modulator HflC [Lentisphaeria bacterium]|nr:protease modulator HflC [Lentisphaeria bacterium]
MNKFKKHWPAYTMGLLVGFVFLLSSFSFQVNEYEKVVIIRLGKPLKQVYSPGLHLKWIYPIDRVWREDGRLRVFSGKTGRLEETQTADGKNIMVAISINWKIKDAVLFIERLHSISRAESELNTLVRSAKNAVLGHYKLSELINSDTKILRISQVSSELLKVLKDQALTYGIDIVSVGLQQLTFPESVASSVFNRMRSERRRLIEKYRGEGNGEALKIKADADADAQRILADAEAKAKIIRAEGDAASAEYYKVFNKNLKLATLLRKLEALKLTIDSKTTLILDTNSAPFDLLNQSDKGKVNGK